MVLFPQVEECSLQARRSVSRPRGTGQPHIPQRRAGIARCLLLRTRAWPARRASSAGNAPLARLSASARARLASSQRHSLWSAAPRLMSAWTLCSGRCATQEPGCRSPLPSRCRPASTAYAPEPRARDRARRGLRPARNAPRLRTGDAAPRPSVPRACSPARRPVQPMARRAGYARAGAPATTRSAPERKASRWCPPARAMTSRASRGSLAMRHRSTAFSTSPVASSAAAVSSRRAWKRAGPVLLDGFLPQELAEEPMVAIRAFLIGGEGEDAVRLQVREDPVRAAGRADPRREVDGNVLETTGPTQERPDLRRFSRVDLLGEILKDVVLEPGVGEGALKGVDADELHAGRQGRRSPASPRWCRQYPRLAQGAG